MNTSLSKYNEFNATINEVVAAGNFIPDVSTKEGYEKSKRVAIDGRKVWNAVDKTRKVLGEEARQLVTDINNEGKKYLSMIDSAINPHLEAYKEHDAEIKRKEDEAAQAITDRIEAFKEPIMNAYSLNSEELASVIDSLQSDTLDGFGNRTIEAGKVRESAVNQLTEIRAQKIMAEENAKQLAMQQAELEKQQEEQRKAQEIINEATKIEREKLDAERAVIEEEQRKAQEDQRVKIAAEQARQAELERQKAELEREAAELEKREANKKHVGKIRKEAKEKFMAIGMDEEIAKKVVLAISNGEIPHVSISY